MLIFMATVIIKMIVMNMLIVIIIVNVVILMIFTWKGKNKKSWQSLSFWQTGGGAIDITIMMTMTMQTKEDYDDSKTLWR